MSKRIQGHSSLHQHHTQQLAGPLHAAIVEMVNTGSSETLVQIMRDEGLIVLHDNATNEAAIRAEMNTHPEPKDCAPTQRRKQVVNSDNGLGVPPSRRDVLDAQFRVKFAQNYVRRHVLHQLTKCFEYTNCSIFVIGSELRDRIRNPRTKTEITPSDFLEDIAEALRFEGYEAFATKDYVFAARNPIVEISGKLERLEAVAPKIRQLQQRRAHPWFHTDRPSGFVCERLHPDTQATMCLQAILPVLNHFKLEVIE